jgi:hypothetical protein
MSLEIEFFEERQRVYTEYKEKGYLNLNDFLSQTGLSIEQLIKVGVLEHKEWESTADLHDYRVSQKGRQYFKLASHQLILLNKTNQQRLLDLSELKAIFITKTQD